MIKNSINPVKERNGKACLKIRWVAIIFLNAALTLPALAHDVTVNLTGKVTNATCTVSSDSIYKPVLLGYIPLKTFYQYPMSSAPVEFKINLENCGAVSRGVQVTFSGTPDDNVPDYFKLSNDGSDDSASGIAVEIMDDARKIIPVDGKSKSYLITSGATTKSLVFYAKMVTNGDALKTGNVNSNATFVTAYP
ncbi:fimbrial protein [Lelliottia aquatilis]|uniref:fimbrial protein n=1 Tax=Lelliottia aquatilis TaxID=2080838 RepID=UPI00192B53BB|nr:fimbrial protein [Lelliottia aquatilis]MBL5884422.1 fimbrial protein [Lelliottia aquatilis]